MKTSVGQAAESSVAERSGAASTLTPLSATELLSILREPGVWERYSESGELIDVRASMSLSSLRRAGRRVQRMRKCGGALIVEALSEEGLVERTDTLRRRHSPLGEILAAVVDAQERNRSTAGSAAARVRAWQLLNVAGAKLEAAALRSAIEALGHEGGRALTDERLSRILEQAAHSSTESQACAHVLGEAWNEGGLELLRAARAAVAAPTTTSAAVAPRVGTVAAEVGTVEP